MLKRTLIGCIGLLLLLSGQPAVPQSTGSHEHAQDSLPAVKQLLKEYVMQQLQQTGSGKKLEHNGLTGLLKDTAVFDTLSKFLLAQMQQVKNTAIGTGKSILTAAAGTSKDLLQQQFAVVLQTTQVKQVFSQLAGMLRQPVVQFKGASVSMVGQIAPSLFNSGSIFVNSNTVSSGWTFWGIPMGLQFSRQDFTGPEYHSRNIFAFKFDREAWLHSLRDRIKLKIKPADLFPDYNDALQKIKQAALSRLKTSLDSINRAYSGFLEKQLSGLGNLEGLLNGDIAAVQDKLLSADFLQDIEGKRNQLAILQQQLNTSGQPGRLVYDSLRQAVQSVAGVNEMINTIRSFKEAIQKTGLLDKLQTAAAFKNNSIQQWLQQPDKLVSLAKDQLDLNGLQKLFLNINQLQMGMNTVSLSPLTVYQYTNYGLNAAFVKNKNYLFVMAGRQKEFSNLYDTRLPSATFATDNMAMGVRIGRGDLENSHAHFSLFNYKQENSSYGSNLISVVPRKTIVATFSHQLKMTELNYLNLEISTSSGKYDNQKNISDTLLPGSRFSSQLPGGDNFMQQLAFTLQWSGEVKERQLSYALHGTRIGRGYLNPGSLFLSRGMTALGGSIRKNYLKNKLQLSASGNYREYAFGTGNSKWRNYNFAFQGKWKLKKSQWIGLRYQPNGSLQYRNDKSTSIGNSNRLSLDMNSRRRFGKVNYQQVISLAVMKNNYRYDSMPVNNTSFLLSSMQTITVNNKSYYFNMQYNKAGATSLLAIFSTQFTCDGGLVYALGKRLLASAALNYNSTKDWFQQLGIKQGVSGQLGQQFIISVYTDIVKNIKEYRPNNMDKLRVDWSLQYFLK